MAGRSPPARRERPSARPRRAPVPARRGVARALRPRAGRAAAGHPALVTPRRPHRPRRPRRPGPRRGVRLTASGFGVRLSPDGREGLPVAGRDVLLSDDGLATGATVRAASGELRAGAPRRLVFASPVRAAELAAALPAT